MPSDSPRNQQVPLNIEGDKAKLLFDLVHNKRLIHDIDRPIGNKFLEVIGERLPTKIEPFHPVVEGEVLQHRRGMGEGESTVDDEAALSAGGAADVGPAVGLIEVDEGGGVGDMEGAEAEFLEDELVGGTLEGGWVEEGFDEEEGGVGGVEAEEGVEEAVPEVLLEVGVEEVAAAEGVAERGKGEVVACGEELVGEEPPLAGGASTGGAGGAVGDDGEVEASGEVEGRRRDGGWGLGL